MGEEPKMNDNVNISIETYIESSYEKYKSYDRFRFVLDVLSRRINDGNTFLDVGCAKGEFIYFLKEIYPNVKYTGLEISEQLLDMARLEPQLSGVEFLQGDARGFSLERKFDHALMSGVLSIFDDFERPLFNMVNHIKSGGWGYVFGNFNADDIDVIIRYRNNYIGSSEWESGLNLFSLSTIGKALKPIACEINIHKFNLSVDLPKEANPIKSFTMNTIEKGKIVLNGANIITDFYLIEFQKA
ncbi:MAG: class I SAM-dependent methyltransferase [Acidobacteriota bacterium]